MTTPHAANMSARPLNPDTELPMPSASAAQQQLADNLVARLLDDLGDSIGTARLAVIRDALVEVAVRQHGRTLRSCIAELREQADAADADARTVLTEAVGSDGTVSASRVSSVNTLALSALALRIAAPRLRGDRA